FFQAEDGIRDRNVTGVQTCALPILSIEAEVGSIGGEEDGVVGMGEIADPEQCAKIAGLGIDFLAAGIGNIHGKYPANWKGLDFRSEERRVGKGCRAWKGARASTQKR